MSNIKRSGLGKGIEALISVKEDVEIGKVVKEVSINQIEPSAQQPRQTFDKEKIDNLAASIKEHGIIQPLIVTKAGNVYKIIAGERRWRAARVAGLTKIPVIEREANTRDIIELALIENIQREDLNPIEEAEAYSKLVSEYNITQEYIAEIVGKSRPTITNTMRLLHFCTEIKDQISLGAITVGQAKPLLGLQDEEMQKRAVAEIIEKGYNARQSEQLVKKLQKGLEKAQEKADAKDNDEMASSLEKNQEINYIQRKLSETLGTKVKLEDKNNKGKIIIEYFTSDERERLLDYILKGDN